MKPEDVPQPRPQKERETVEIPATPRRTIRTWERRAKSLERKRRARKTRTALRARYPWTNQKR